MAGRRFRFPRIPRSDMCAGYKWSCGNGMHMKSAPPPTQLRSQISEFEGPAHLVHPKSAGPSRRGDWIRTSDFLVPKNAEALNPA